MATSRRSARKMLSFAPKGSVLPCGVCKDPVGTWGGKSISFPCAHKVCSGCAGFGVDVEALQHVVCPVCGVAPHDSNAVIIASHEPLLAQDEVFQICREYLFRRGVQGDNPSVKPFPMHRMPPIFQDPHTYAGDKLFNTSAMKGAAAALDFDGYWDDDDYDQSPVKDDGDGGRGSGSLA